MRQAPVRASALLACLALLTGPVCAADAPPAPVLPALRVRVVEGDGAVHRVNTRTSDRLTIQITDTTGQPVSGAVVSFQLPDRGPGGMFANGLRTDIQTTDDRGLASSDTIDWNNRTGALQIRVLARREQSVTTVSSPQYLTEFAAASPAPEPTTVAVAPRQTVPSAQPVSPEPAQPAPPRREVVTAVRKADETVDQEKPRSRFFSTRNILLFLSIATTGVYFAAEHIGQSEPGFAPVGVAPPKIGAPIVTIGGNP